jgi:hypothetical protein
MKLREKFQQTNASKQKQGKEKDRAYKCAGVYGSRKSSQLLQDCIPCLCTDMIPCIEHSIAESLMFPDQFHNI